VPANRKSGGPVISTRPTNDRVHKKNPRGGLRLSIPKEIFLRGKENLKRKTEGKSRGIETTGKNVEGKRRKISSPICCRRVTQGKTDGGRQSPHQTKFMKRIEHQSKENTGTTRNLQEKQNTENLKRVAFELFKALVWWPRTNQTV